MIITKKLGDSINYSDYNAIVYLLRKFKKLKTTLQLGAYELTSDFGDFTFTKGFENIGNNFILNNDVSVTSSNVLKNTFYTFIFSVLDVNLSGIVNKRTVKITGSTGEDGALELNINESLIDDNEVIMPNFDVEIVFDEHEYYTPLIGINFDLSVNKRIILQGESCVITGILTNNDGEPLKNRPIPLSIGNYVRWLVTDTEGKISHTYAGTGEKGKIIVSAYGESVFFYDGVDMYVNATVSSDSIKLGYHPYSPQNDWLHTDTNVIIDWGDGTVDTVFNPLDPLIHQYNDGLSEHVIVFDDIDILGFRTFSRCTGLTSVNIPNTVTSIGGSCFSGCTSLTSINIPDSVASIGSNCFDSCSNLKSVNISNNVTLLPSQCFFACTNLESIEIPASVTNIGGGCFTNCRSLKSYDLNWENNPVTYSTNKYKVFAGTVFYIPYGTTDIYVDAGYPSDKLVERSPSSIISQLPTPIMNIFNQAQNGTYYLYWDLSGVNGALNNIPATIIDNVLKLSEEVGIFLFYDVLSTDDIENDTPIIPVFPRWSGYDLTLANTHELFENWVLNMSECYERYPSSIPVLFYDMPYPSFEEGAMRKDGEIGVGMSKPLTEDEYNAIKKSSDPLYVDFTGKFKLGVFDIANDSPNFIII